MREFILLGLISSLPVQAEAATYNFFFNSTEQGESSVANPAIKVKEEKSPSASSQTTPIALEIPDAESDEPGRWRLALGAGFGSYSNHARLGQPRASDPKWPVGSLHYFPNPQIGIGLLAGQFTGPELEFNPYRLNRFRFAMTSGLYKDFVGFNAPDKHLFSFIVDIFRKPPEYKRKPVNLFWGVQAGVHVTEKISLNAAYRFAPFSKYGRFASLTSLTANADF